MRRHFQWWCSRDQLICINWHCGINNGILGELAYTIYLAVRNGTGTELGLDLMQCFSLLRSYNPYQSLAWPCSNYLSTSTVFTWPSYIHLLLLPQTNLEQLPLRWIQPMSCFNNDSAVEWCRLHSTAAIVTLHLYLLWH